MQKKTAIRLNPGGCSDEIEEAILIFILMKGFVRPKSIIVDGIEFRHHVNRFHIGKYKFTVYQDCGDKQFSINCKRGHRWIAGLNLCLDHYGNTVIADGAVIKKFQRKGIYKTMIRLALFYCHKNGINEILSLDRSPMADAFWRSVNLPKQLLDFGSFQIYSISTQI